MDISAVWNQLSRGLEIRIQCRDHCLHQEYVVLPCNLHHFFAFFRTDGKRLFTKDMFPIFHAYLGILNVGLVRSTDIYSLYRGIRGHLGN